MGDAPAPPVVTALEPDTAVLGTPSFTIHVHGTGFTAASVIVWNGSDELTTVVSATEVTTGVNMATASVAMTRAGRGAERGRGQQRADRSRSPRPPPPGRRVAGAPPVLRGRARSPSIRARDAMTRTGLQVITDSLKLLGVVAGHEVPTAAEQQDAFARLNELIDSWGLHAQTLLVSRRDVIPLLPTVQTYTIGPGLDVDLPTPMAIDDVAYVIPSAPETEVFLARRDRPVRRRAPAEAAHRRRRRRSSTTPARTATASSGSGRCRRSRPTS